MSMDGGTSYTSTLQPKPKLASSLPVHIEASSAGAHSPARLCGALARALLMGECFSTR